MNFCVTPAGAWGTAMALHLVRLRHTVTLVPHRFEEALEITTTRRNEAYLSGFELPEDLQIGAEFAPSLMEAEVLVMAVPSRYLRSACRELLAALAPATRLRAVVCLTKGLEEETRLLPSQVIEAELPGLEVLSLSGPGFARQLAAGQPTAQVLGGAESATRLATQAAMSGGSLRIYASNDRSGVELGGCLKNVYAIAAGLCDGLGLKDNSKAALMTRALAEMVRVGLELGGQRETFYGLSGFGDLVLTCYGQESRNRKFGEVVARGMSAVEASEKQGKTVEGYRTCLAFQQLCTDRRVDAPILREVYQILFKGQEARQAIADLMGRPLRCESAP